MTESGLAERTEAVRRFNRFYTKRIGVLLEGLLKSPYSLTEARLIYELAHHGETTAGELGAELGLDNGYLSRLLGGFEKQGLIQKARCPSDGRRSLLRLSDQGQAAFALLNSRSRNQIGALLDDLPTDDQSRLVAAMATIEQVLEAKPETRAPYLLRPHQPGDMGWVVHRHGVLYAQEHGWDERFEALVAGVVAQFIESFEPTRERCWIAEVAGQNVGSVFLVDRGEGVAKLRLLLVEPRARGLGIGRRLVAECIAFARRTGYRTITLWTNGNLDAARRLYIETGFTLVESAPHHSFGHDLIGETWELALTPSQ